MTRRKRSAGSDEDDSSAVRYFNKVSNSIQGSREQKFSVAMAQTMNRERGMGAQLLGQAILKRILDKREIEGSTGPYYSLMNRLCSLVMKGASSQVLESAMKLGRSQRLEGGILEEMAAVFFIVE